MSLLASGVVEALRDLWRDALDAADLAAVPVVVGTLARLDDMSTCARLGGELDSLPGSSSGAPGVETRWPDRDDDRLRGISASHVIIEHLVTVGAESETGDVGDDAALARLAETDAVVHALAAALATDPTLGGLVIQAVIQGGHVNQFGHGVDESGVGGSWSFAATRVSVLERA